MPGFQPVCLCVWQGGGGQERERGGDEKPNGEFLMEPKYHFYERLVIGTHNDAVGAGGWGLGRGTTSAGLWRTFRHVQITWGYIPCKVTCPCRLTVGGFKPAPHLHVSRRCSRAVGGDGVGGQDKWAHVWVKSMLASQFLSAAAGFGTANNSFASDTIKPEDFYHCYFSRAQQGAAAINKNASEPNCLIWDKCFGYLKRKNVCFANKTSKNPQHWKWLSLTLLLLIKKKKRKRKMSWEIFFQQAQRITEENYWGSHVSISIYPEIASH